LLPGRQRGLIGATLLKAQFERSAYGCRLFCCWCAQDLAANRFWEAMGFVPLAFRAGSAGRGKNGGARVHIFWQRRIRAGDVTTPWWYPSKTSGGSIREDRIVLPVPLGTHWSDVRPMILPALSGVEGPGEESSDFGELSSSLSLRAEGSRAEVSGQKSDSRSLPAPTRRAKKDRPVEKRNAVPRNGMWFDVPRQPEPTATACPERRRGGKPAREKKRKAPHDRRLVAAARELRDRYLEHVNGQVLACEGKYDVSRQMGVERATATAISSDAPKSLPAPVATAA